MNLLRSSMLFLKKNAPMILTCAGSAGVIATSIMAAKATPKALTLLENAKIEKGEDLTKTEKIKVAGPAYIPTVITGVSTIVCIFGANSLNTRQKSALMSAYALLVKKLDQLYEEDTVDKIEDKIVKDKYNENPYPIENEKELFYDNFSQRYFEATTEKVLYAEHVLNRRMAYAHSAYLNEFYELLGLEPMDYGEFLGWFCNEICDTYKESQIKFDHSKIIMDDGLEVTIIRMCTEPTFYFEDY